MKYTYVDKYYPWSRILAAGAFTIISTGNRLKGYSPGQFVFFSDMIPPIKHMVHWELICQKKQTQTNKDNVRKNINIVNHNYKIRDKVMLVNNTAYKYETTYSGPFVITKCWTNGMVTLHCVATNFRHNICCIKPRTYDTNVEDIKC